MNYLATKKGEHEDKCEAALRGGASGDAVFHAAKAAEFALALAKQTSGRIAERYVAEAEGWLEIAAKIKSNPPGRKQRASGAAARAEEESPERDGQWLVTEKPSVTFDMIAGMVQAKQAIRQMVIDPLSHPEKARALGLKPGGGMLLFGPPGNGKTMLGKAIAHELDAPFYYASGAQVRSKWHGESEQRLRALMRAAREQPVAVLFFDEVEGLLPRRGGGGSVVDNRIVTQFLAEIGGFEESGNTLLLLGATNLPWEIDDAAFRTGRFDEKIFIGLPDLPARTGIIAMQLDGVSCAPDLSAEAWAQRMEGYTGSDIVGVVHSAKRGCLSRSIGEEGDPVLLEEDMERGMKGIPPSVTPQLMKRYGSFNEQRFR